MRGSRADAKTCALKLLGYRSRSRKEMIERLKRKGFSSVQINDTIRFLENSGLISDESLASELLRYSTERKSLGKKGIEAFLAKRGLDKELISMTLLNHTKDMEQEVAKKLLGKKLKALKNCPQDVIRRRLWGMLQRRGFSMDVINRAVESVTHSE